MKDDKLGELQISAELMKKLHKCTQEILDAFVDICKKHNLRYYLFYGTLLGAVRHEGPIPWDDDVDVCMPREDYERLKRIMLARPQGETYHIHCFENDPNSPLDDSPDSSSLFMRLLSWIIRWMKMLLTTRVLKTIKYVKFKRNLDIVKVSFSIEEKVRKMEGLYEG